jgi:hypothetical protein
MKLGQAFGRLPAQAHELSESETQFLTTVASGLALDGKVVCVRLALFAEMVKGKPWTAATLEDVGGTEGIGINFLEETFSSREANPEYRLHQQAAREVLEALLPETGSDIKDTMRSHEELLIASGYQSRPCDFGDLLRILDGALRLITPTDPQGPGTDSNSDPGSKYYQLTHDYLVPALRGWLTQKEEETEAGRARLRLRELAALWNATPEDQRLPIWEEFLTISKLTDAEGWSPSQGSMMEQAGRYHAERLLNQLWDANLSDVPGIICRVERIRKWCDPLLVEANRGPDARFRMYSAIAMLPIDASPTISAYLT